MDIYKKYNLTKEDYAAYIIPNGMYHSIDELAKITRNGNKVYCFGVGKASGFFCENIKHYKFDIDNLCFVDNNIEKIGNSILLGNEEVRIISKFDMEMNIKSDDIILITTYPQTAVGIYNDLIKNENLKKNEIMLLKIAPTFNGDDKLALGTFKIQNSNEGLCPICETRTNFIQLGLMPRYEYLCASCFTAPRSRAIINAINKFVPNWRDLSIHESSADGKTMEYFKERCNGYSVSQYFPNVSSGERAKYNGVDWTCQDLQNMSFEDETFDIVITQEVFEHVFEPEKAFNEICRVLKKGGIHIFTIPWYSGYEKTRCRAQINDKGEIVYLEKAMYHGGTTEKSSLVTYDYGRDIVDMIYKRTSMVTTIYLHENEKLGLYGDFLEVFISKKI